MIAIVSIITVILLTKKSISYFSPDTCSVPCGGGKRYQSVWCESDNKQIDNSFCDSGTKPNNTVDCNSQTCFNTDILNCMIKPDRVNPNSFGAVSFQLLNKDNLSMALLVNPPDNFKEVSNDQIPSNYYFLLQYYSTTPNFWALWSYYDTQYPASVSLTPTSTSGDYIVSTGGNQYKIGFGMMNNLLYIVTYQNSIPMYGALTIGTDGFLHFIQSSLPIISQYIPSKNSCII